MSEIIRAQGLTKSYKLYPNPKARLKEWLHPLRKKYHHPFMALKGVSFSVQEGETLGIVGQNGSGKSTLLQIITGVLAHSSGSLEVKGKIAALLELGAGFDKELTGRQNLYLNGAIQGLSRHEVEDSIEEIQEFAQIGEFFDQPVRLYSSGMFVRLAFSAAIHVNPDILIVDEALSVGDVKFQNKCFRKFNQFKEAGKTILFVTHGTDLITKHCDRALLLHQGDLLLDGEPNKVINRYLELLLGPQSKTASAPPKPSQVTKRLTLDPGNWAEYPKEIQRFAQAHPEQDLCPKNPVYNPNEHRYGNRQGEILNFLLYAKGQCNPLQFEMGDNLEVFALYRFHQSASIPVYGLTLKTLDGVEVTGINNLGEKKKVTAKEAGEYSLLHFVLPLNLIPGEYFISLGLASFEGGEVIPLERRYDLIHLKIKGTSGRYGLVDLGQAMQELSG